MKFKKKYSILLFLVLTLSLITPAAIPFSNTVTAQAATSKINKKSLSLEVGKTFNLKITGTKQKVSWSSSDKSIAVVSNTGKVTAKKAGKATITATVGKQKFTCKVTVMEATVSKNVKEATVSKNVKNAPFEAKEAVQGKIKYILPKEWNSTVLAEQGGNVVLLITPAKIDAQNGSSNVNLLISETGEPATDYALAKALFEGTYTEASFKKQWQAQDSKVIISNFKTSDYDSKLGTAFKTEFQADFSNGLKCSTVVYCILIDNYFIQVSTTDIGDNATPDANTAGEYLLNTLEVIK